ncbi:MAG: AMP-binding protein [Clostridiales bacterium]|nr:AMP-binding protein [Clostridiales bacterium]
MKPLFTEYCTITKTGEITLTIPDQFNFAYDVVDRIAKEDPDRRALVWLQDESCALYQSSPVHKQTFTFGELADLSTKTALYLTACGIKRGDRVMLLLKRHYSYWYTLLALHKIGAVALPAVCMLNEEELAYRIETADISAVICLGEEELCEKVTRAAKKARNTSPCRLFNIEQDFPEFERLDTAIAAYPAHMTRIETKKEEPLLLYFTSGTTGQPKMVLHDGTYPLAHIQTALLWQNVRDGGLHLSIADTGWAKASWGKIYGQWICGSAVMAYDYDAFSAVRMLEAIRLCKVTTFCAPPTIYRFFVKNNLLDKGFGQVAYATTAGESIHPEIVKQFFNMTGLNIHVGYGQTESALLAADFVGKPIRTGALGLPSPLYRPIIIDSEGNECAPGVSGEIVICRKNGCPAGFCTPTPANPPKKGEQEDGFYHTGDIAKKDKDGYFWFIGRVDDVIKSSGYRISPFEVENVLIQHHAVMDCAVTGVPDEQRGFVIKATIVLRDGYTPDSTTTNMLRNFVKEKTADYKVPRMIDYVSKLPQTFNGKIRRVAIREQDKNKYGA